MADILLCPFFVAWIVSTVWVWFDAKPRDWTNSSLVAKTHRQWVLGFWLMWPAFAPFYLPARRKAPLRSAPESLNAKRIVLTLVAAVVVWFVLLVLEGFLFGLAGASISGPFADTLVTLTIPFSLWYSWRQTGRWEAKRQQRAT
jgi:hypothetical protein